jgi:SAM-dependent methyltransferase
MMNRTLHTTAEVDDSLRRIARLRLPPHIGREKNWDALLTFDFIRHHGSMNSSVLDMGAADYGVILPWLESCGYKDLHGCDQAFEGTFAKGAVRYRRQDITKTDYPEGMFDFITCLSVVEHGVDEGKLLDESVRLLKPGGYLILSTDYWKTPVVEGTIHDQMYQCELKVYDRNAIEGLVSKASMKGLRLTSSLDASVCEKAVHWERFDLRFTFIILAWQKKETNNTEIR